METNTVAQETQNYVPEWLKELRKEDANRRRIRYATDAAYRQREIERSRRNRWIARRHRSSIFMLNKFLNEISKSNFVDGFRGTTDGSKWTLTIEAPIKSEFTGRSA